tara:strand:- start:774 stop:1028 length:255 start_codon:yes stop_codon:yes gene_type:complete
MTEKDIVRLAEEAELWLHTDRKYEAVEKFAKLVAAAEREACAKLCDENTNPNADKYEPVSQYQSGCYITAEYLATTIRARGQDD